MANKRLAKRQKMTIRLEPSQKFLKPKNPYAMAARQRSAGAHSPAISSRRQQQKRTLSKTLNGPEGEES